MDNKFNRFLKETKADQQKKEREEKKALKQEQKKLQLLQKLLKKDALKLTKGSKKKITKTKDSMTNLTKEETPNTNLNTNLGWEDGGLWSWSSNAPESTEPNEPTEPTEPTESTDTIKTPTVKIKENTTPNLGGAEEEPKSLFEVFRSQGNKKWLGQDYPAARAAFNLINNSIHPEKPMAEGIAVLAIKGTSFEGKREACLEMYRAVRQGKNSGEVNLIPDPSNPHDPNAVGVFDAKTGKQLGFIPKAKDVNQCYGQSIRDGKFIGGYILDGKETYLKNQENALLIIATGWVY
jgi:hypothetical protein